MLNLTLNPSLKRVPVDRVEVEQHHKELLASYS